MSLLLAASMALLGGCAPQERQATFLCMGTVMDLRIWSSDEALVDTAQQLLMDYDAMLDPDGDGTLAELNAGETMIPGDDLGHILSLSLDARERTDRAFSPAVYRAARAWGFLPDGIAPSLPDQEALDGFIRDEALLSSLALPDSINPSESLALPQGVQLVFGAIAKGWAGDRLYDLLEEAGAASAILSLGGNIICYGARPDGSDWQVGLAHPRDEGVYAQVSARDVHIVTSADDQRYYLDAEGNRVCHIIDPRTMLPARAGLISVTVIARAGEDAGAWADILTTAAFVLGREQGLALLDAFEPAISYVAVAEDGEVLLGGDQDIARIVLR